MTTLPTPALFANLEACGVPLSPRQIELDRTAKLGEWHDGPLVEFQGIVSRCTASGYFQTAAVRDVDEFLQHHGEPVTHERAVEIASQQGGWTPGWWDAWDKAVAEFTQDCLDAQGDVS